MPYSSFAATGMSLFPFLKEKIIWHLKSVGRVIFTKSLFVLSNQLVESIQNGFSKYLNFKKIVKI